MGQSEGLSVNTLIGCNANQNFVYGVCVGTFEQAFMFLILVFIQGLKPNWDFLSFAPQT